MSTGPPLMGNSGTRRWIKSRNWTGLKEEPTKTNMIGFATLDFFLGSSNCWVKIIHGILSTKIEASRFVFVSIFVSDVR